MSNFLINKYQNKVINSKLIKNYRYFIEVNDFISLNYFYWLYQMEYNFSVEGYSLKFFFGNNSMSSFILYNNIKNIRINQIFFFNNPFIFFIKKKNNILKKKKKIYIL